MTILNVEVILRDNVLFFRKMRSCELVGSGKLKSEVNKGDMREKKGRLKNKKKP